VLVRSASGQRFPATKVSSDAVAAGAPLIDAERRAAGFQ
jgi:hypothetical protein